MKRYTGSLDPEIQELLDNNLAAIKGLNAPGLARPTGATYTIDETVKKYNPGITLDEVKAWVWYRKKQGVPMSSWKSYFVKESETLLFNWVKKGVVFFDPMQDAYVPYPVFVFGNLYTKIAKLKKKKETVIEKFGEGIYDNHIKILEDLKPNPLSIQNPVVGERPVILAISTFPKEYKLSTLRESTGVILEEEVTLLAAFESWLRNLSDELIQKTTSFQIIAYYLDAEKKPRDIEKIEWNKIKKITREEGERLFSEFLHEALETKDQQRIDAYYNSMYNSTAPLQYQKIPIGIEVSRNFMGNTLEVRQAQREGIAFMELVGSGIVAYDVGVGKTITAIIEVVTAIKNGKCKRPVIAVPNPTYKNWMKEMEGEGDLAGVLTGTGIKVNDWFNLGTKYDHIKVDRKVPEKSITLVSYEGLMKIGFNEHTQSDHFEQLSDIVGQVDPEGTDRDQEKQNEKFREIVGVGNKGTIADIEDIGFDYVVIDEAHNFKNIFSEVKSDKDNKKQFHVKGGVPSNRAIKAFFLCNYIQRKFGRNVMLLTATPFTNSPLEIYSMLSLVAYQYMRDNNIVNLRQFFEQYIAETVEYVVGQDGEIKQKSVVKSFNNRVSLQKLINSHINFKTGEEANIPRPCKVNLPKTTTVNDAGDIVKLPQDKQILTYLEQGDEQSEIQREINSLASEGASRDDPGRLLSLMADSQNNALSPFLVGKSPQSHVSHLDKGDPENYLDFINESPKIKYAMECIATVKKHHEKTSTPISGQVIYIDRGKQYFKYIKEYLVKHIGFKESEIQVMQGGMTAAKKEKIKDDFNAGKVKIIIGTSTIKEGVNLQERSSVLYNLYPNWNPTDIRQLEGRVWRQKNKFNYVRVVMPLMENSMDVFVFQKLEEKTSRINDLWSKSDRGNVLDEESLDPNEVKFALVTDLNVLVRFEMSQVKEELYNNVKILENRIGDLANYAKLQSQYAELRKQNLDDIFSYIAQFPNLRVYENNGASFTFREIPSLKMDQYPQAAELAVERFQKAYDRLLAIEQGEQDDKSIIQAKAGYKRILSYYQSYDYRFDRYKDVVSQLGKIKRTLFKNRGYDENTDTLEIQQELEKELEDAKVELSEANSPEFEKSIYDDIVEKKKKYGIDGSDVVTRVSEFQKMNHLLDYKFEKISARACKIPTENFVKPKGIDKQKRIRIARARAKAILIQLELEALK